ncbi:MAG: hypothetical protein QMD12_03545, partial [Candidatus Aenigmarchaeota archaeon]|nr:hypothetical protein [Candidatus Aenigmarchaeota archaeon]
ALRKNSIVAAAPSIRPRDSKKLGRRSGTIGLNCMTWLSTKLPTIEIGNTLIAGPSVPGCSFVLLREVALKLWKETGQLYDPELAIAEDYRFSRLIGRYGRVSYEKRAGTFVRTSRVTTGFDILKSVGYAIKWLPYYLFPDLWRYKEHKLRI